MNNLVELIKKARFIWICGNGGSAETAQHFSADLVKKGYKAICLNSNPAVLTMFANDYGYEHIFSKQLELYGSDKDLLITISCSGTSANIIEVLSIALLLRMKSYEFETFGEEKDYGKLEDKHLQFAHEIVKQL